MKTLDRASSSFFAAVLLVAACGPVDASDLTKIVPPGSKVEKLASGFKFVEGPAFGPQGFLLFSDIPANQIYRYLGDEKAESFLHPSGNSNGLLFDAGGDLWVCQHERRRVVRIDPAKPSEEHVIADVYDGKRLNSPNDLALDGHGGLYFTDPRYPRGERIDQPVKGVYWVSPEGDLVRVIESLELPNGILVSPDGKTLYVAENATSEIFQWPILSPGKLGERALFYKGDARRDGGCDGMEIDRDGNVYATFNRGIAVIAPDGSLIGTIDVPERPANCAFGGEDRKTLYITAVTSLYAIKLAIPGAPLRKSGPKAKRADKEDPSAARDDATGKAEVRERKFRELVLRVPASWREGEPSSTMRLAEFAIDAAEGDSEGAEVVVFYFAGGVGGLDANVARWVGQFEEKDREGTIRKGTSSAGREYTLIDLTGTFRQPVGPPVLGRSRPMSGWRVANVWIEDPKGAYVLKIAGPKTTVTRSFEAFRESFGAAAADRERETKIEE